MRIRKHRRGNAEGEASDARTRGGSQQEEQLVSSSRGVEEKTDELVVDLMINPRNQNILRVVGGDAQRAGSPSGASPTWLEKLQSARGTFAPLEPYMNLDEFVSSLARENCFPAEEITPTHGDGSNYTQARESNLMSTVQSNEPHFERLAGGSNVLPAAAQSSHAELDTSLRLGQAMSVEEKRRSVSAQVVLQPRLQPSYPMAASRKPSDDRGKTKVDYAEFQFEYDSEKDSSENLAREYRVKRRDNWSGGQIERSSPPPSPVEACGESYEARRTSPILKPAQLELQLSPSDHQTMKSSTESMGKMNSSTDSMERRFSKKRRVSSSTGKPKRGHSPSPVAATTEHLPELEPDHPAKQPRRSLMFSLYTVFQEAGRLGLTAGEAMSTMIQQGLAGIEDSEGHSRRQITKLLRNSPYFMELGERKFALCSAMVDEDVDTEDNDPSQQDCEEEAVGSDYSSQQAEFSKRPRTSTLHVSSSPLAMDSEKRRQEVRLQRSTREMKDSGTATAGVSSQRIQTTETGRKPSSRSGRPKRLKYLRQDNVEELGNQCNRSDGKGWTCPLLAKTGYQLCDHHLDKLRCKPGSRSKYNKKKRR